MKTICAISLSLLLLLAVGIEGWVTFSRNQCQCIHTSSGRRIQLEQVADFQVFQADHSCNRLEYIVRLKNQKRKRCLKPSPEVQRMYEDYQALKKTQYRRRRHH